MLKIKHKHRLKQNYFLDRPSAARMQFSHSELDVADEVAKAIVTDDDTHDNKWVLDERPDGEQLAAFWAKVRDEARQDPNWNFADDEA